MTINIPLKADQFTEEHLQFCDSILQQDVLRSILETKSPTKTAKLLNKNKRNVQKTLEVIRNKAIRHGLAPEHDLTKPQAHALSGASTMYKAPRDENNNIIPGAPLDVSLQWIKTDAREVERQEAIRVMIDALKEEITPVKPLKFIGKKQFDANITNTIILTDAHIGMHSWGEQTGADYDLKIAEELIVGLFSYIVSKSPNAEHVTLAQLGDLLHYDSLEAVTPGSKHIVDADGRYQKVVRVAIYVLRKVILMLLQRYKTVHVIMAEGNHDLATSAVFREMMDEFYRLEPRVTVDLSPDPYYCHEHGKVTQFFHHGHKRGVKNVDSTFVAKFREEYGRSTYSYAHMGHRHSREEFESNLMVVTQHPTLAGLDDYASSAGYNAMRSASCISYHKEYGECGNIRANPDMIRDHIKENDNEIIKQRKARKRIK